VVELAHARRDGGRGGRGRDELPGFDLRCPIDNEVRSPRRQLGGQPSGERVGVDAGRGDGEAHDRRVLLYDKQLHTAERWTW
jgi:hypothetical protein